MKRYGDLPVYFIIFGLILNLIMYYYNRVSFTSLMIRSSVVIVLFAAMGYILAAALESAHTALSKANKSSMEEGEDAEKYKEGNPPSAIDIRVQSEDDDELLRLLPQEEEDEFTEVDPETFRRFMNQDS